MLGFAWLALRQVREALDNGRLEEAHRLLCQPAAQGHKRSFELQRQVVQAFVQRGERQLAKDDPEAAWNDLLQAEQLDPHGSEPERLRQALVKRALNQVRAHLQTGDPGKAADAAARLRGRSVRQPEVILLDEAARAWLQARDLAARGEFPQALETLERVRRLLPGEASALERFFEEVSGRRDSFAELQRQLHEATEAARWRDVLETADKVLAMAPQHAEARRARALAWKAAEPATVSQAIPASVPVAASPETQGQRFLLWVDGVGGYLVCLQPRVTLGQATPDGYVDVPFFADVSRVHATMTRDREGYLLEAVRPVQLNGEATVKALLRPNDRITLGTSCQVQFRVPAPVSSTARLDLVSGHRLSFAVSAVLLMADTLILGSGTQVHVDIPDLKNSVILYRTREGLGVRCPGTFTVDGRRVQERAPLLPTSQVSGEDYSFALEPIRGGSAES